MYGLFKIPNKKPHPEAIPQGAAAAAQLIRGYFNFGSAAPIFGQVKAGYAKGHHTFHTPITGPFELQHHTAVGLQVFHFCAVQRALHTEHIVTVFIFFGLHRHRQQVGLVSRSHSQTAKAGFLQQAVHFVLFQHTAAPIGHKRFLRCRVVLPLFYAQSKAAVKIKKEEEVFFLFLSLFYPKICWA